MYQALYRKYRPQTFSDVVGQKSVTETLRAQLAAGKLSHAYLFTGTRGTGKTTCAKILATAVNCLDPQNGDPCNRCAACKAIDSGSCMDVLEIDAASNNGIDNVRVLRDDAVYSPSEVKMRVYIIDEVHMLSTQAFNALLKIIEEPPAHLLFILATTELHKVPATILSRCQRYAFRRLQPEDIAGRINFVACEEKINIEPAAIQLLARLADGALRDGLSLLDQCASAAAGTVTEALVCDTLGIAGMRSAAELLQAVAEQNAAEALALFSRLYAAGKDVSAMLDELCSLARDLLILKTAPESGLSMLSGICGDQQALSLKERFSAGELLRLTELLQQTVSGFARSTNRRLDAELCLLQMCRPELQTDTQSLNARIGRLEEQLASGSISIKREQPPKPEEREPEKPQPQEEQPTKQPQQQPATFWPELAASIGAELGAAERGFFAPNGPITALLSDSTLTLTAQSQFVLDMIRRKEVESVIRTKAAAFFRKPVAVRFTLKGQADFGGDDPLDELIAFGGQRKDIFTIK